MARLTILGATGSLGRHVLRQALTDRHDVSVVVRTPGKLPDELRNGVVVHQADLSTLPSSELADMVRGQDAVINTAGLVTEGPVFVELIDRIVTSLESVPERPVCWFLAGAALLDIDASGRRGVDLPRIRSTYGPHRTNFERLQRSSLDWRMLCPGPMVEQPPLGLARMRTSLDHLPVRVPGFARVLPGALFLPVFAYIVPEMIVSYADAASLMLANLDRDGTTSNHRVGLALPEGMRGKKAVWAARPKGTA